MKKEEDTLKTVAVTEVTGDPQEMRATVGRENLKQEGVFVPEAMAGA